MEVRDIRYPELILRDGPGVNPLNVGRKCEHGVILKVVTTNICGSDQHMVRGRTTAPSGLVLGHEITGEVIEVGRDVEFIKRGDRSIYSMTCPKNPSSTVLIPYTIKDNPSEGKGIR